MNHIEKTLKNSVISVAGQLATFALQFINRRVFVMFLDIELLGYQTLFSSVFNVLSIAELGIGNIISFHLYREIVENNEIEMGKLMWVYKQLYRIVACVVLAIGLALSFFLPMFVTGESYDWGYIRLIYYLQLASVVVGYFFSYRRTIYIASQQEYRCVEVDLVVGVAVQIAQLFILFLFHNYLMYLCLQLSTSIIANCVIAFKTSKDYPFLKEKCRVTREDIRNRNLVPDLGNLLVHKISYAVYGSSDNIILSAFGGVKNVALLGNYMILKQGVMQVLFYKLLNPVQATIGNIVHSDRGSDELWRQFEALDVFSFYFASFIGIGFLVFFQPVITLWMGVEYLLPDEFVWVFSVSIYLGAVWEIVYKYRSVFGDYRQDRNCMVLSAVLNIAFSIPGAIWFGVVGVQLGTLAAFLPIAYGRIRFVVKNCFGKNLWRYLAKHAALLLVVMAEGIVCWLLTSDLAFDLLGIALRIVVWISIPLIFDTLIYFRNPHFVDMVGYLSRIIDIVRSKAALKGGDGE